MGASFLMLIIAGVVGIIIGWMLHSPKVGPANLEELEASWRAKLDAKLKELDQLHAAGVAHVSQIADLEAKLAASATHVAGLEAMVHGRDTALHELTGRSTTS